MDSDRAALDLVLARLLARALVAELRAEEDALQQRAGEDRKNGDAPAAGGQTRRAIECGREAAPTCTA